jgi:hypothetical protein
MLGMD